MRKSVCFRLDEKTIGIISNISKTLNITMTEVVERALEEYMKKFSRERSELLKYAGILSSEEANAMLKAIKETKVNKEMEYKL